MAAILRRCRAIACRSSVLAVAGFLLAGCLAPRRQSAPPYVVRTPQEQYPSVEQTTVNGLTSASVHTVSSFQARTKPVNVLALCASGVDCPFAAGALVGWSKAGSRPTFDVVTGTSSGALVGMYAFLGPKYDGKLQTLFTKVSSADLFHIRPVGYLLRDRVIASPEPLERFLAAEINESFLADLREAHAQGRRFFVGTANLETKRLVVWDVGAIASSGDANAPALVRKVLQATITWPALLPPVEFQIEVNGEIRREQHIDGGAAAQCFVRFAETTSWPRPDEPARGWLTGSNLYILAGGRLYDNPTPAPNGIFGQIFTGASCLINSLTRADMLHLYMVCQSSGMQFHLLSLPQEHASQAQTMVKLNQLEMRRLFDTGYRLTSAGATWRHIPPGAGPGEEEVPRGAPTATTGR